MDRRLACLTTVTGLALVAPVLAGVPAHASGGGADVVRSGSCSSHADWKVKVKRDDGRIELEAEVDSDQARQTWPWRIRHNGSTSAHGRATTTPPSGSFSVRRRMTDLAGTDSFRFRATNPHTGEVCHGSVRL